MNKPFISVTKKNEAEAECWCQWSFAGNVKETLLVSKLHYESHEIRDRIKKEKAIA